MTTTRLAALLIATLVAGCATPRTAPSVVEHEVTGYVHAGPVCPVAQDPPDPACADRPVAGATLLAVDAAGVTFGETRTDAAGRFTMALPAGTWTLVPQPVEGLLGTAPPLEFVLDRDAAPIELDVAYDTGIR